VDGSKEGNECDDKHTTHIHTHPYTHPRPNSPFIPTAQLTHHVAVEDVLDAVDGVRVRVRVLSRILAVLCVWVCVLGGRRG
jgi:hypothetical protein